MRLKRQEVTDWAKSFRQKESPFQSPPSYRSRFGTAQSAGSALTCVTAVTD
jgi:hypothetical protein